MCEWDFEGANLCTNSGVYLSREKALEVLSKGFPFDSFGNCETVTDLEERDMFEIEEIEIE
jgi:hypothetical protein